MKRDDFKKKTPEQNYWRFFHFIIVFLFFCLFFDA